MREFIKSENFMVLIIVLNSVITACTKTEKEMEYEYKNKTG